MRPAVPSIGGVVAALAVALAPAAIHPPHPSAFPAGGGSGSEHCKPGALSKDENGKVVAVCNTRGQWVKVIRRTDGGGTQTPLAGAPS